MKKLALLVFIVLLFPLLYSQVEKDYSKVTIALLKYGGGGDWYGDRNAIPNLARFVNQNLPVRVSEEVKIVSPMDDDLFSYPYIFMAGHGNVRFTEEEVLRLRKYLTSGGFLHADDDYGMDKYFRREIKRIFPNNELVELPFDHPIYHIYYDFPHGLPKIHEHDGKPPQGFGIFYRGRLVVFYSYETDLGDGWEDPEVHHDPEEKRLQALKMGANILLYSLLY
ncbi:MAG: hypothetical protein DRP88_01890 [Candidatus Neomarinimicrobiota bacterium]|nr:MAG: hypothetical protein DRP88_01890 [Candidatus Neomarinimicrobiota bacterium]